MTTNGPVSSQEVETAIRDALRDLPSLHTGRLADHGDAYRLLRRLADAGYVVVPAVSGVPGEVDLMQEALG